jgi:hypothetical protein
MNVTTSPAPATSGPASRPAAQVSPDELLGGFSGGHLLRWFLAAAAIHAVLIGGFSLGTIRDWLDPEAAEVRRQAALAAAQAAPQAAARPTAAAADTPVDTPSADSKPAGSQTPIEKATTEAAKPGEIPSVPDDLGLSIDDTNPQ